MYLLDLRRKGQSVPVGLLLVLAHFGLRVAVRQVEVEDVDVGLSTLHILLVPHNIILIRRRLPGHLVPVRRCLLTRWHDLTTH